MVPRVWWAAEQTWQQEQDVRYAIRHKGCLLLLQQLHLPLQGLLAARRWPLGGDVCARV
jgi:hypothetical protein